MKKSKGWRGASRRHGLAAKGIKTTVAGQILQRHPKMSQKEAKELFDVTMGAIRTGIKKQKRVSIPGFGTFKVKKTKAKPKRKGRNPFTGKETWLKPKPAGTKIRFRQAKEF